MTVEHAFGFVLTPTMFNNICENYRQKVDNNPENYPYWANRSPVQALKEYFKKAGFKKEPIRRENLIDLKFLNESNEEIYVDNFNNLHIPFFYFFPCDRQYVAFDAVNAWENGYRNKAEISMEIEKKFEYIKQFFNPMDWKIFTSTIVWLLYVK